jgi:hypothetical protein
LRIRSLAAAVGAFLITLSASALASDLRGYQAQDATAVAGMSIEVVQGPARIRPQIAYGFVDTPYPTTYQAAPGLTYGQTMGANLVAGAVASLIVNASVHAEMKRNAAGAYAVIKAAGCDSDLQVPVGAPVRTALSAAWPAAQVRMHPITEPQASKQILSAQSPRYVFEVSTSLAPDFSALITTIDSDAYPAAAGQAAPAHDPAWHDSIILVSDRIASGNKTQADIDAMVAQENARFDALGTDKTVAMINKDIAGGDPYAHQDALRKLKEQRKEHENLLNMARLNFWLPAPLALKNANIMAENKCARLNEAVAQSATLASDAIAALAAGKLPPRLSPKDKISAVETDGQRATIALPGGLFLSRRGGDNVPLGFRYSLLPE